MLHFIRYVLYMLIYSWVFPLYQVMPITAWIGSALIVRAAWGAWDDMWSQIDNPEEAEHESE